MSLRGIYRTKCVVYWIAKLVLDNQTEKVYNLLRSMFCLCNENQKEAKCT